MPKPRKEGKKGIKRSKTAQKKRRNNIIYAIISTLLYFTFLGTLSGFVFFNIGDPQLVFGFWPFDLSVPIMIVGTLIYSFLISYLTRKIRKK